MPTSLAIFLNIPKQRSVEQKVLQSCDVISCIHDCGQVGSQTRAKTMSASSHPGTRITNTRTYIRNIEHIQEKA